MPAYSAGISCIKQESGMENEVRLLLPTNIYEDIKRSTKSDVNFFSLKNKSVLIAPADELLGFYLVCSILISNDIYGTNTKVIAVGSTDAIFKKYGKLTYRSDIEFTVSKDFSGITERCDYVIYTKKPESQIEIAGLINYIKANKSISLIGCDSEIYGDVFNGKSSISEKDMGYSDCHNPSSSAVQLERVLESAAKIAAAQYKLDIKFARICQIFGYKAYGNHSGYIKIFRNVSDKKNIEIEKSDKTLRSYIYVTDAASAVIKILTDGKTSEVYNISSGYLASNHIIAKYCVKLFENLGIKIIYKDKESFISPMAPTLDNLENTKLKALGFTPETELQEGIVRAIKNLYEVKE